jgi:hypothetical protein
MKNPFKKATTVQKLQNDIAQLATQAERLAAKRVTEQQALDKAIKARQEALLAVDDIDDARLAKLQVAVTDASSLLQGIDDAISILARRQSEAESQLAVERDRSERAKASEEISAAVDCIEARVEPMLSAVRELAKALSELDHLTFEGGQLGRYLSGAAGEAEIAVAFVLPEVRRLAQAVKDGTAAIPRRPRDPEPVGVVEPPPTQTVFMLRSARYRDHDGRTRFAGQYEDATMPVPTAQRALHHGAAVPTTDERRARLRGARGGDFNFGASDVVDLDGIEEHSGVPCIGPDAVDPVLGEARFTKLDRGAARTGTISVARVL